MAKKVITEAEVDRRVAEQMVRMSARGSGPFPLETMRALARTHLEMTAPNVPSGQVPQASPLVAPVALKPALRPVRALPVTSPPPAVLAERVRAQRIIAMAPKDAEGEVVKALRSGMSVAEFEGVLAARAILDARRRAGGR